MKFRCINPVEALIAVLLLSCCDSGEEGKTVVGGAGTGTGTGGAEVPGGETIDVPPSDPDAVDYLSLHDAVADKGQFYMPDNPVSPEKYWTCVDCTDNADLSGALLGQSLAGIVNRAMENGRTAVGIWLDLSMESYLRAKSAMEGEEIGRQTAMELVSKDYGPVDGIAVAVKGLIDGYVLTDLENNPESNIVASVAAHVYNSIVVDVKDRDFFEQCGYEMKYDARDKTTEDAWNEFRDRCSNAALVVMPVETAELREFAIRNSLFVLNLNKAYGTDAKGQNSRLFGEVLEWLAPNAPVLGWEQGVGEDVFVDRVSRSGHLMTAADWSYNHTLTSLNYKGRQTETLAKVVNPRDIDYSLAKHFVSFFLSDGDNFQWVMGDGFCGEYYSQASGPGARMSYGLCSEVLCQLSPAQFNYIYGQQDASATLMECFGGGYFYADDYSMNGSRAENLKIIADRTAAHMRQHRLKILHLIAKDVTSSEMKEACQAFVDANDLIEGIVAIQYSPYNGGKGEILWCTNGKGYDIPVVTVKYSLWKDGSDGQGSPAEMAALMAAGESGVSHSFVCVHAWSDFDGKKGPDAAASCIRSLPATFKAVNAQELVWRIRMRYRKEQTLEYLRTIK